MTTDCSLNHIPSSEHVVCTNWFFVFIFRTIDVHNMFWAWNFHVLNWWFNEQSVVILWVIWCKNKSFWQLITITESNSLLLAQLITNDPEGEFRRPPQSVLDSLAQANQHYKIGHLLCRSRSPDFLLDILQRQVNYKILWCPVFDDFCANVL